MLFSQYCFLLVGREQIYERETRVELSVQELQTTAYLNKSINELIYNSYIKKKVPIFTHIFTYFFLLLCLSDSII